MNNNQIILVLLFATLWAMPNIDAQVVASAGTATIKLPDGQEVTVLPALEDGMPTRNYYYLPFNLRLSGSEYEEPEFLLMLWSKSDPDKVDEGIMHWLFTWGPTLKQQRWLDSLVVSQVDSSAVILGAVPVQAPEKYTISGDDEALKTLLQRSISSGGSAPNLPGGKSATSFRFGKAEDAATISNISGNAKAWKNIEIEIPLLYQAWHKGSVITRQTMLTLNGAAIMNEALKCKACFIGTK